MKVILLFLVIAWGGYSLLPYIYTRIIPWISSRIGRLSFTSDVPRFLRHMTIVRTLPRGHQVVALTFDDGPDPVYTPMLLDLLAAHRIRATFFVIGERAAKHPELIRSIAAAGHEIGIHNGRHWPNWLLSPWSVQRHLRHTTALLYELTGQWPTLYRPPWGLLNLFDLFRSRIQIVLWSVMVNDWRASAEKVELMSQRLARRVTDGSIIVLHDCGATFGARRDAPRYMLQALARWLQASRDQWRFATIREGLALVEGKPDESNKQTVVDSTSAQVIQPHTLSPRRRLHASFATLWLAWDDLVLRLLRIHPVAPQHPFLHVRVRPYKGKQRLQLDEDTVVQKGDLIAEIHLNNRMIHAFSQAYPSMMQMMVAVLRRFQPALPHLASYLRRHPFRSQIKAVYGISLLHQPAERFGFTVLELENRIFTRMTNSYLQLVLRLLQPDRWRRQQHTARQLEPKVIALSVNKLLHMYPDDVLETRPSS